MKCPMCGVSIQGDTNEERAYYQGRGAPEKGVYIDVNVCSPACGRASILAERMHNIAYVLSDIELQLRLAREDRLS